MLTLHTFFFLKSNDKILLGLALLIFSRKQYIFPICFLRVPHISNYVATTLCHTPHTFHPPVLCAIWNMCRWRDGTGLDAISPARTRENRDTHTHTNIHHTHTWTSKHNQHITAQSLLHNRRHDAYMCGGGGHTPSCVLSLAFCMTARDTNTPGTTLCHPHTLLCTLYSLPLYSILTPYPRYNVRHLPAKKNTHKKKPVLGSRWRRNVCKCFYWFFALFLFIFKHI